MTRHLIRAPRPPPAEMVVEIEEVVVAEAVAAVVVEEGEVMAVVAVVVATVPPRTRLGSCCLRWDITRASSPKLSRRRARTMLNRSPLGFLITASMMAT